MHAPAREQLAQEAQLVICMPSLIGTPLPLRKARNRCGLSAPHAASVAPARKTKWSRRASLIRHGRASLEGMFAGKGTPPDNSPKTRKGPEPAPLRGDASQRRETAGIRLLVNDNVVRPRETLLGAFRAAHVKWQGIPANPPPPARPRPAKGTQTVGGREPAPAPRRATWVTSRVQHHAPSPKTPRGHTPDTGAAAPVGGGQDAAPNVGTERVPPPRYGGRGSADARLAPTATSGRRC